MRYAPMRMPQKHLILTHYANPDWLVISASVRVIGRVFGLLLW